MAREFTMPKLGLTMTDGTIREWLVPEGTDVTPGEAVLVIETDKVETEVEARESGRFVPTATIGENYECGAIIGWLLEPGESVPAATQVVPTTAVSGAPIAAVADQVVAPGATTDGALVASSAGNTVAARGERGRILASPRARAAANELGLNLESIAGTGPGGRIVQPDVIAHSASTTRTASVAVAAQRAAPTSASASASSGASATVSAGSGARMLADLLGVDLALVEPSSPGARVSREDVAGWVRARLHQGATPETVSPASAGSAETSVVAPDGSGAAPLASAPSITEAPLLQTPTTSVPMTGMRGVIAQRMHGSLAEMAQLTLSIDADMTAVEAERARLTALDQTVPGFTAWVVAAVARSLADHPYVNSQIVDGAVAYLPEVNIGIAVALEDGLIVPVVHLANEQSVVRLHEAVADVAARAREGKLGLSDLEGGTFSVTALGMYGVDMFTPVINPPNTAILGVGRLRTDTAWSNGKPSPVTLLTLSLTWDHRAFDGAPAAEFAQSVVRYLEDPAKLA